MPHDEVRVVSLLPSATELIACVLDEHKAQGGGPAVVLVGRSHECDFPQHLVDGLPMLTASRISKAADSAEIDRQVREHLAAGQGLYSVDHGELSALRPDILITQSLCKVCSVDFCLVESIAKGLDPQPKVVDTNPMSLEDVMQDVQRVGAAMGLPAAATAAAQGLRRRVASAIAMAAELSGLQGDGLEQQQQQQQQQQQPCVLFCEWPDPVFCGGHWTPQLIGMAGGRHTLNMPREGAGAPPSFVVTPEAIQQSDPDVIIVAPCGYDMAETKRQLPALVDQPWWQSLRAVQSGNVWLVDGNQMFNRPGPRLVDALEWLVAVLHGRPELAPPGFPAERWQRNGGEAVEA